MNAECITTNECLVAGGVVLPLSECVICCKQTKQKAGYVGVYCPNCKRIITGDEWIGNIAKQRRELLGYTKKQIGDIVGLSKHTIHSYEWRKCPKKYIDKLKELLQKR